MTWQACMVHFHMLNFTYVLAADYYSFLVSFSFQAHGVRLSVQRASAFAINVLRELIAKVLVKYRMPAARLVQLATTAHLRQLA